MTNTTTNTKTVTLERDIAHPPEKVWRALTQPHLIEEWLMKTDFEPSVDHTFQFHGDWGSVDGRVLTVEPYTSLVYTWAAMGVETIVTWTLTPTDTGTHLRVEQAGFSAEPEFARYYQGAQYGWQNFLGKLETVLARA